jgi:3-hydroxyacyl-[acyl-carrier-protein] dehydratase
MLKDSFYKIDSLQKEDNSFRIMLTLNREHNIFKGHFPGHPVVPGACLVQMVKEITEMILDRRILLKRADSIKFIRLINPNEYSNLQFHIIPVSKDDITSVLTAILSHDDVVFFKFSGQFSLQKHY